MNPRFWLIAAAAFALTGCGNAFDADATRAALSTRQRDSTIARSVLPGAGVVGRALGESNRAAVRAASFGAQVDSLAR